MTGLDRARAAAQAALTTWDDHGAMSPRAAAVLAETLRTLLAELAAAETPPDVPGQPPPDAGDSD